MSLNVNKLIGTIFVVFHLPIYLKSISYEAKYVDLNLQMC